MKGKKEKEQKKTLWPGNRFPCGPRCSEQGGRHWCPPSAIGDCGVFKAQYVPTDAEFSKWLLK